MKRWAMVLPLMLLAGCTEQTEIEDAANKQVPQAVSQEEEQQEQPQQAQQQEDTVEHAPTAQQQQPTAQAVTEPLQFEPVEAKTEAGKHYSRMLQQMMAPNVTSYTAQVSVSEEMEWEELGHFMTQIVTLGATIQAKQGDTQQRLLTGEYIQEMNDIRENTNVSAYEELSEEYAAYFNEGTMWYRTDPTTMKEQVAVGFYIESIDMLLSHFEQLADELKLATETDASATYVLTLPNEAVQPVVKKLLQRDDYNVLAPFNEVENTATFTIAKGDKPLLEQLSMDVHATTSTGTLSHTSTLTFTAINEPMTIIRPTGIEEAVVFDVQ
ncbi:MAG: hypothetical protein KIG60_04890 [Caryophanon sp.]|nr:hypothetical protein [Caryophanon sp.]